MNSTEIAKQFADLDLIMASCFLDTLSVDELEKTLEQAYKALKDKGILFHISDLPPYFNRFLVEMKDCPGIIFPLWEEGRFAGVRVYTKKECEEVLKKLEPIQRDTAEFFKKYINASNKQRVVFLQLIEDRYKSTLSDWLKPNFDTDGKVIRIEEHFEERLRKAIAKTAFTILRCELDIQEELVPNQNTEFNEIECTRGWITKRVGLLPMSDLKKICKIHVLVLQKDASLKREVKSCCTIM